MPTMRGVELVHVDHMSIAREDDSRARERNTQDGDEGTSATLFVRGAVHSRRATCGNNEYMLSKLSSRWDTRNTCERAQPCERRVSTSDQLLIRYHP